MNSFCKRITSTLSKQLSRLDRITQVRQEHQQKVSLRRKNVSRESAKKSALDLSHSFNLLSKTCLFTVTVSGFADHLRRTSAIKIMLTNLNKRQSTSLGHVDLSSCAKSLGEYRTRSDRTSFNASQSLGKDQQYREKHDIPDEGLLDRVWEYRKDTSGGYFCESGKYCYQSQRILDLSRELLACHFSSTEAY